MSGLVLTPLTPRYGKNQQLLLQKITPSVFFLLGRSWTSYGNFP
jgi:hypothetical protein